MTTSQEVSQEVLDSILNVWCMVTERELPSTVLEEKATVLGIEGEDIHTITKDGTVIYSQMVTTPGAFYVEEFPNVKVWEDFLAQDDLHAIEYLEQLQNKG